MTKAMVLAAGVGSRLEPISHFIPKPLVPVLNTPVISHILAVLKQHDICQVIANTHYLSDTLIEYFRENPAAGMSLEFRFEAELSGDAGGVRSCREFFDEGTFVVIMGDLITSADISRLIRAHKSKGALATIGVKTMQDVTRFGVMLRDKQGFVKAFQEKPKAEEAISQEISTGIYILEPQVFNYIPQSGVYGFGRQLFPALVSQGLPVLGEEIVGYWSDIGTLTDLFRANMDALAGKIPVSKPARAATDLFPGVRLDKNILIGNRVRIARGSSVGPSSIIGDDCTIEENVSLQNCVLFADSRIESGKVLKDCIYAFDEIIPIDSEVVTALSVEHS